MKNTTGFVIILFIIIVITAGILALTGKNKAPLKNANAVANINTPSANTNASPANSNNAVNLNSNTTVNSNTNSAPFNTNGSTNTSPANTNAANNTNSANTNTSGTVTSATVTATSTGFVPSTITVSVGGTVTWVNASGTTVYVAPDDHPTHLKYAGIWDDTGAGNIANGQSYSFVFSQVGTYTYHDHLDPTSTGTVVVR